MLNTSELLAIILGAPYVATSAYVGQDGKPHACLEVTAESVRFLGGKNGANGVPGAGQGEPEIDID